MARYRILVSTIDGINGKSKLHFPEVVDESQIPNLKAQIQSGHVEEVPEIVETEKGKIAVRGAVNADIIAQKVLDKINIKSLKAELKAELIAELEGSKDVDITVEALKSDHTSEDLRESIESHGGSYKASDSKDELAEILYELLTKK